METSTTIEITDNAFLRQYECTKNGNLAKIEYSQQERKIFLTKFIIPESLEDDADFKNDFLRAVFINIRDEKKIKVVPTHPKIAGFVRRNRNEFKEMLPVGISI
ncbi:N-acetyltransferase [Nonlabens arenilitoris]|uniref:N-acetyltransferase n=1 Tax=Nonlabens arenilitoris TaxID=1217969 RepID=A0A2S7UE65_9FLAO|nr:N-acetyltransferase [Nonlabens arenilitoris]PQJ32714.1 N-acetyltransferase [Nonlabens arenilitoris]